MLATVPDVESEQARDCSGEFDDCDEDELQLLYDESCDQLVDLQRELRVAELDVQQLQLRHCAARKSKLGTAESARCPGSKTSDDQKLVDLSRFFIWLSENVAIDDPPEIFDVGFSVPVGGRTVHLRRVAQWPLQSNSRGLQLSIPVDHQDEIVRILSTARAAVTPTAALDIDVVHQLASTWDLVPGELRIAAASRPEPAVLLAHRSSRQGILVASWPTPEALEAFHTCTAGEAPRVGDRVEVEYDGQWFIGVLHSIDASGKGSVKCDVDDPGVLTLAPLSSLRRPSESVESELESVSSEQMQPDMTHASDESQLQSVDSSLGTMNSSN